jgi:hypothetical protein
LELQQPQQPLELLPLPRVLLLPPLLRRDLRDDRLQLRLPLRLVLLCRSFARPRSRRLRPTVTAKTAAAAALRIRRGAPPSNSAGRCLRRSGATAPLARPAAAIPGCTREFLRGEQQRQQPVGARIRRACGRGGPGTEHAVLGRAGWPVDDVLSLLRGARQSERRGRRGGGGDVLLILLLLMLRR